MGGLLATVLIAAVACGLLTGSQTAILASLYDYPLGLLSVGVALGGAFTGLLAGAFHRRRSSRASSESATLLLAFSAPLGAAGTALAFTDWVWTIPGMLLILVAWAAPFAALVGVWGAATRRSGTRGVSFGLAVLGVGYLGGVVGGVWVQNALGGPIDTGWAAAAVIGIAGLAAGVTIKRLWSSGAALAAVWMMATATGWAVAPFPFAPGAAAVRPLYRHRAPPAGAVLHRVQWRNGVRDDELHAVGEPLATFYSNGTPPILSAAGGRKRIRAAVGADRFPLLALPALVARPRRALVIGAAAGVSRQVMRRLGVEHVRVLSYDPALQSMIDTGGWGASLPGVGLPVRVRAVLAQDRSRYGVILLPLGQSCGAGRCASNAPEAPLLTREALASYWRHLVPGGVLAVATNDWGLSLRAMLMAWGLPDPQGETGRAALVRHAWGVDAMRGMSSTSPYRHLLLVVKGVAAPPGLVARMRDAAVDLPIVVRFGPGFRATGPYRLLEHATRARVAEVVIGSFSRTYRERADFRTATDRHPFFFVTVRSGAPRLKWLFGAASLGLILIALWAAPGLPRSARAPEAAERPPIPVILSVFAAAGGGLALVVTGLGERLTLAAGSQVFGAGAVLGACFIGLAIGRALAGCANRHRTPLAGACAWLAPVVAAAVAFGTDRLVVAHHLESAPAFELYAGTAAVAVAVALAGAACAVALVRAYRGLQRTLYPLERAAAGVCALGAVAGSALAPWLAQVYSFEKMWIVALALGAAVFIVGAWTWGFAAPPARVDSVHGGFADEVPDGCWP